VDGIRQAAVLDQPAKEIAEAKLDEALVAGYGIFSGKATAWAKLRFTPERARWIAAEDWHPKQRAHFQDDGAYVLEFPYSDDRELIGDILRHGAEVEVLAPAALRKKVAAAHAAATQRYK
jgi:predicted DNA-binding transcriptional regulator YafY